MKKFWLIVIAMLTFAGVKAQEGMIDVPRPIMDEGFRFHFGIKGGYNLTNMSQGFPKNMSAYHGGIFAEFRLNNRFGIQPELLYSKQGERKLDYGDRRYMNLQYIHLPIMAKVYFGDKFSAEIGPQFGYCIEGKYKYKLDGKVQWDDKIKGLNELEVGMGIGGSYMDPSGFLFSLRYNVGFTSVYDNKGRKNYPDKPKYSVNLVFQASVGWRF